MTEIQNVFPLIHVQKTKKNPMNLFFGNVTRGLGSYHQDFFVAWGIFLPDGGVFCVSQHRVAPHGSAVSPDLGPYLRPPCISSLRLL